VSEGFVAMMAELLELRRMFKNRKLPPEELEALQAKRLRAVIRNAYDHVPYYRSLFKSAGISPDDIHTPADLRNVPISTKEEMRAAGPEQTVADWVRPGSLFSMETSGSTGKPFTVYRTDVELRTIGLLHIATLITFGQRPWDRLALIGPNWPLTPRLYHRVGLYRSKSIPLFTPVDEQIRQLKEFQPTVLLIYPSALRALIHNLGYPLRNLIRPRILITAAEVLDRTLKDRVQANLDSEIFDTYGAIECGRISWECPAHEGLHINSDHFILEGLDGDQPVGAEESGTVVVTKLFGFAMPFIRYRLGDLCELSERTCSCGCPFPLMSHALGRELASVRLPSGRMLSSYRFDHILRVLPGIYQWQVVQESYDHFVIKLVMQGQDIEHSIDTIRAQVLEYLNEPVSLEIQLSDDIIDEGRKFQFFVSKVEP
jgi:phenylacetate-CoA ligase